MTAALTRAAGLTALHAGAERGQQRREARGAEGAPPLRKRLGVDQRLAGGDPRVVTTQVGGREVGHHRSPERRQRIAAVVEVAGRIADVVEMDAVDVVPLGDVTDDRGCVGHRFGRHRREVEALDFRRLGCAHSAPGVRDSPGCADRRSTVRRPARAGPSAIRGGGRSRARAPAADRRHWHTRLTLIHAWTWSPASCALAIVVASGSKAGWAASDAGRGSIPCWK